MQVNGVKAWIVRSGIDASCVTIDPVRDGAVGVVIVGIHSRIAPHLIAVPAFPHGCGAVVDQVAPRRVFSALQHAESNIEVTGVSERPEQIWRAEKSSAQLSVIGSDAIDQALSSKQAMIFVEQIHV